MPVLFLVLFFSTNIVNINCIQDKRDDDKDQQLSITSALSKFSFKTCLQFKPVLEQPKPDAHVLVLENPHGIRRCVINTKGHAVEEPHRLTIGFDCLSSPRIDMMIMRALGLPFEHNRASRDIYIDVLLENVDQGAIELYAKEQKLPIELRALPYDVNSVMHFDDRENSKNGHRTFLFKNPNTRQNRIGLSPMDLQKINIIYGPECKSRDRLAKLKICSNYPENKRRKREADSKNNATLENRNDVIDADKEDNHLPVQVDKNITNLSRSTGNNFDAQSPSNGPEQFTIDAISEGVNIARNSDTDEMLAELVRNIKQVRKLSIALAKKNKEKRKLARTKATEEEMALAAVNLLFTLNTSSTDVETSGLKVARYGDNDKCSSGEHPKHKNDDCESKDVSTKDSKCNKEYYSTKIRPPRVYTQLRNVFFSTRYPKNRRNDYNKEDSSVRRKREANAADKVDSGKNVGYLHNVTKRKNTTVISKNARRTYFINRGIFDNGNGIIKIENYAAITLPQFGGFSKENVKKDLEEDLETKIIRNKETSEDEGVPIKKEKPEIYETVDNIQQTSAKTPFEFGMTTKVEKNILPQTVQLSQGNKDFYGERIWPEGIVYYTIENNPKYDINEVRQKLEEVNKILQTYTCVELQEITGDNKKLDYIVLDTSADFVVGRVGGKQNFGVLELFEGGQHRQHAAMVVMGMLGFYLEPARHDRDKYVLVHMRHIRPDKLHHFEKLHADATLALPYDYRSATHPPWQYWRRLGKTGISSVATHKDKDPDGKIMRALGQNSRLLSKMDLVKINSVYGTSCFENPSDV